MVHAQASLLRATGLVVACALIWGWSIPAPAQTIVDDWAKVQAPAAPELKPAALDPKTTALVVMDFVKQTCSVRPRCPAIIPKIKALIATAKAKGVTVIWTLYAGRTPDDFVSDVAPPAGTTFVIAPADKFFRTDLEKMLRDKGITTVIPVGVAAEAAVLYTAGEASLRGFKVVVPVDGMASGDLYGEQAAAWTLSHASSIAQNVTLTKLDMIAFQ